MKPKLESAYIAVENIDRAINFYEWFLERTAAKKGESLYLFDVGGFRLFLFDHNKENEEVKYGDNCLLSFEVDDAEKTKEKIEVRGLKIIFPLTKILDNIVFEFEDPEGNQIEVFSKVSERKQMNNISYRRLKKDEIKLSLFSNFDRHQEVTKCWRKENKKWILKNISFTENWGIDEYEFLVKCLQKTIKTGGTIFGAFKEKNLVGFASLENQFFGSKNNYLQLSSIHTSNNYRGQGIGKNLFKLICKKAKDAGAEKLYISAHSAEETQLFYKAMGCKEAVEYNERLVAKEPYDCQLEYVL